MTKRIWTTLLKLEQFCNTVLVFSGVFIAWMLIGFWFAIIGYLARIAVDGFLFGYKLMFIHVGLLADKLEEK